MESIKVRTLKTQAMESIKVRSIKLRLCLYGIYLDKKYENLDHVCVESIRVRSMKTRAMFVWSI